MIKELLNKFGGHNQITPKGKQLTPQIEEKTTSNQTDQVMFSQEDIQKANNDMAEMKKQLEGKSPEEAKSFIKTFLKDHSELAILGGLQIASLAAQGSNQQETMKALEDIQSKLNPKDLKKLSRDYDSAQINEFMGQNHDVEKEMAKLKSLGASHKLYKSTPIRGFLKDAGRVTLVGLWTAGPLAAAGLISYLSHFDSDVVFGSVIGALFGSIFTNVPGWLAGFEHVKEMQPEYHTQIGTAEALERLDKHKKVEIAGSYGRITDKVKNLSQLSIID